MAIDKEKKLLQFKEDGSKDASYDLYSGSFTAEEVANLRDKFVAKYGCDADTVRFEFSVHHGYYDEIDYRIEVTGSRVENDAEYELRMADEKASRKAKADMARTVAASKEARDKAEYERLKAKFGV